MSVNAWWINPKGEISKPSSRHIATVIENPKYFGETKETLQATFDKYNEPMSVSVEGKAREEILLRIIEKRGFIRIRFGGTRRNQKWSIQLNKLTSKAKDALWLWAKTILDKKLTSDKFADVVIHQLINNKMTRTSLNKIASGEDIKEAVIYEDKDLSKLENYFDYAAKLIDEDTSQEAIDEIIEHDNMNLMYKYL